MAQPITTAAGNNKANWMRLSMRTNDCRGLSLEDFAGGDGSGWPDGIGIGASYTPPVVWWGGVDWARLQSLCENCRFGVESRQGRLKITKDVVLASSPIFLFRKPGNPGLASWASSAVPAGLEVVPISTQHCVLGYSQASLRDLVLSWSSHADTSARAVRFGHCQGLFAVPQASVEKACTWTTTIPLKPTAGLIGCPSIFRR